MTPLRIGFAGANPERGWAKDAHFPALKALPGLSVHAVSARTQEIANAAAEAFGAARAFGDSLAMARDPEVDVVAVTVKVPEHRAIVLAALETGKHVYCEWPLARDLTEAQELAEAARRAGTHVCIGLQGASTLPVQFAAAQIREGTLGEPQTLKVVSTTQGWGKVAPPFYAYLQDKRNGATLASIAGGHTLAMVEEVAGEFTEVRAQCGIRNPLVEIAGTGETVERTCADHLLIEGRHADGCRSSVEVVGGTNEPLFFEMIGAAGKLEIHGHHPGGYQCAHMSCVLPPDARQAPPLPHFGLPDQAINVFLMWQGFAADIRLGKQRMPDFDRAVRLAGLLEAIDKSSETGRTMILGEHGQWHGK